ncbi:unnamed protein product [Rhizophagus irregularis]|nr:unnamed protein product [Rhizophagus irregularis]
MGSENQRKLEMRVEECVFYIKVEDSDEDSDEEKKSRKLKRVNIHLQSTESSQQSTKSLQSISNTSLQASRNLSLLMTTPNKRPLKRKIQHLGVDLEVGKDLTIELSTVHDANPAV